MTKQKPIHEIKIANVRATIWANPLDDGRVIFSVGFSRLFKDVDGWHDATSFRRNELLFIAQAAELAFHWILDQQKNEQLQPIDEQ